MSIRQAFEKAFSSLAPSHEGLGLRTKEIIARQSGDRVEILLRGKLFHSFSREDWEACRGKS